MEVMVLSLQPLDDVQRWASGSGLEIVLLVTGAVLLGRLVGWFETYVTDRIDATATESDALVRSEASKHRHSLAQVGTWAILVVIYTVTAVLVMQRLGVPLAGLVAPATVAGVALGFGAQRIVQDLLAGFFLITERQYGYGDLIRLTLVGTGEPKTGTVEDVTLRVTQMRTLDGEVVTTPNGQIVQVTNLSRDWARAVIDIPVQIGADIARINTVLQDVGAQAYDDPSLRSLLLDPPSVMGVESLEVDQLNIRMVARTLPGRQFEVGRELRSRAAIALREEGLATAGAIETAEPSGMQ
jgi:small-conductance mechanosensitive channel